MKTSAPGHSLNLVLPNFKAAKAGLIILCFLFSTVVQGQEVSDASLREMPEDSGKVNALIELGRQYCSVENDRALGYLQEAFAISTREGFREGTGRSLMWQGRVYYYKDEYELANKFFDLAEKEITEAEDLAARVYLHFFRGEMCKLRKDYINAMYHYEQVLEVSEKSPNKVISSASYMGIGHILMARNDPESALKYFYEGYRQKKEIDDRFGVACVYTLLGEAYVMMGMPDSALYFYQKGLKIREDLDISRVIASSKYSVAGVLIQMGKYDEAIAYLRDAHERFEALEEKTGMCICNYRMAKALNLKGDPAGLELADKAIGQAHKLKNPALLSQAFLSLSEIHEHNGEFRLAYHFLQQHKHIEDSLFSAEKERFLLEFEQKFQSEQKDNKIARYQSEAKIHRQNILLLSISSFTLLAILVLLFILFRYKSQTLKKNALLLEQESVIHSQESRLRENENQILQEQLEAKNRELASKALEMIRFNDTIGSIIEKLEGLNNNERSNPALSAQIRSIIHELENQTKQNIWNEFDKIFKNIHSGFYQRLLERSPDLTPTEIKTAALLKLNLTTKEIAAITFKSEGGIKTTRYRLRKKLNLSSDDKLIPYLMQI